jgi:EAL domain-containing protein (putative c-di-GMP-specific phosphodiesterase class I)
LRDGAAWRRIYLAAIEGTIMNAVTVKDLEKAIDNNEFSLRYQPKICLRSGAIVGAEALMRWRRDDGEMISPGAFIPLAEESGFITNITETLIHHVVTDLPSLARSQPALKVAFNVSPTDLQTPDLVRRLDGYISDGAITADQIEVEMTEETLVADPEAVGRTLADLQSLGLSVTLDDFGAGFSAFDTLCDLPFTTVKLDRRLSRKIQSCAKYQAVMRSLVALADDFNMTTIAEGIEKASQLAEVRRAGCHQAQGFYIARPMRRNALAMTLGENQAS